MIRQFPLMLGQKTSQNLDNFVPGNNAQPLSEVSSCAETPTSSYIFLWGGTGTGKTHLVSAAVKKSNDRGNSAVFIPLSLIPELTPDMLTNLEQMDLVCLDDINQLAGNQEWEIAIFNLFNRCREGSTNLIITADCSPTTLQLKLPDLISRLASGTSYRLSPLDDSAKIEMLIDKAAQLGMNLNKETATYILTNYSRDIGSLLAFIEKLDHESLAAQRKLTIPFVRSLMET